MNYSQDFRVVAVSANSNSFGLKQMIMVSEDGKAFKGCFNYLNVKNEGETISADCHITGSGNKTYLFTGGELIENIPDVPKDILNKIFK